MKKSIYCDIEHDMATCLLLSSPLLQPCVYTHYIANYYCLTGKTAVVNHVKMYKAGEYQLSK